MSTPVQSDLFGEGTPALPEGFRYAAGIVPPAMESSVLDHLATLPFKAFDFHGYQGKRRVVSYGWRYDFGAERLRRAHDIPAFLYPVRTVAAQLAGVSPEILQQALVSEYGPGAPIGWHKDKAVFGVVVGLSLLSQCTFRLRRRVGDKWERATITLEPGSGYVISGPARTQWEHSIPPVENLRYSITFRELRAEALQTP